MATEEAGAPVDGGDASHDGVWSDAATCPGLEDSATAQGCDAAALPAGSAAFYLLGTGGGSQSGTLIESFVVHATGRIERVGRLMTAEQTLSIAWGAGLGRLFAAHARSIASYRGGVAGEALTLVDEVQLALSDRPKALLALGDGHRLLRAGEQSLTVVDVAEDGSLAWRGTTDLPSSTSRRLASSGNGAQIYSTRCEEPIIERRLIRPAEGRLDPPTVQFQTPPKADAPDAPTGVNDLAVDPSERWLLVLSSAGTIHSFALTAPPGAASTHSLGYTPSGLGSDPCGQNERIAVHPDGRFVYVTTDFGTAVAIVGFDPETGTFALIGHHAHTEFRRASLLAVHPNGTHLVVGDDAGKFNVFAIDQTTGLLTFSGAGESQIIYAVDLVVAR